MKRPALALGVAIALPGALCSGACGTEEWWFRDQISLPVSEASLDAEVLDSAPDVQDAPFEADAAEDGCDPDSSRCAVSCAGGAPCPTNMPLCTAPRYLCEPCRSSQDCEYVRSGPICAPSGACLPECTSDRQCNNTRPYCDRPIGRCVRCINNDDCPAGDVCARSECVPGSRDP